MRASYGEGILHCQDPLFSKPSGYAETKTYSGVAYCLTAQVQLIDADSITYLSDNATVNNASTVSSATLLSPTKMCSFHGNHSIKIRQTLVCNMRILVDHLDFNEKGGALISAVQFWR